MIKNWKLSEQAQLFQRLGELLEGGYHVQEALHFFQVSNFLSRKEQWAEAMSEFKNGKSLFHILRKWKFHSDLIIFVMIAEKHGDLGEALKKGSDFIKEINNHKNKVKNMMLYPLFLLIITTMLFTMMIVLLLPKFESMYRRSALESPWSLRILSFLRHDFPSLFFILFLIILVFLVIRIFLLSKVSHTKINQFLMQIPIVRPMLKLYHSYFFPYQWSILLHKGLSYLDCVEFMRQWEEKPFYQEMSIRMRDGLSRGDSLAMIVRSEKIFLKELPYVIEHGQKNGKIERELLSFSTVCFNALENKIRFYSSLIQPICFVSIGLVVVLLYVSIMLPVIQMLEAI